VFPNTVYNAAAGQVAMLLGLTGVTSTVTAGHAAGAAALCIARDLLHRGAADVVVCPAVDTPSPAAIAGYRRMPLFRLPSGRQHTLAEGAYAVVLERSSMAKRRGAAPIGMLAGYGMACDAIGIGQWDSHAAGLERAMRAALADAAIEPAALTAVWANAAGLPSADRPELAAIARLAGSVRVEAPKPLLGDPVGAGAHLCVALAIADHPLGGPVLVNSSSLGGTHVALVLAPWEEW
jgi:3-oxoacyl-[acyl-carrier-protein] synthase II